MGKHNIMLMFFSGYSEDRRRGFVPVNETTEYILENGERMAAYQTNEAPLYSVAKLLADRDEKLDTIYCLTTEKADEKVRLEDGTTMANPLGYWVATVKRRCPELAELSVKRETFRYSSQNDLYEKEPEFDFAAKSQEYVLKMAGQIRKDLREKNISYEDCTMYVDLTGGFRPAALILSAAVELLQYDGLRLGDVLYADWKGGRALNKVFSFTGVSNLYKLVAGADEFFRYGSSRAIDEYFSAQGMAVESSELRELLSAMREFSEVLQLCQTGRVTGSVEKLGHAMDAFLAKPEEKLLPSEQAFRQLAKVIRDSYAEVLAASGEDAIHLSVIKWCKEKKLFQQALTFSTEWLADYLVNEGICEPPQANERRLSLLKMCVEDNRPNWKYNYITIPYAVLAKYRNLIDDSIRQAVKAKWDGSEVPEVLSCHPKVLAYLRGTDKLMGLARAGFKNKAEARRAVECFRRDEAWDYVKPLFGSMNLSGMETLEDSLAAFLSSNSKKIKSGMNNAVNGKKMSPLDACGLESYIYDSPEDQKVLLANGLWKRAFAKEWNHLRPYWKKMFDEWGFAESCYDAGRALKCVRGYFYLRKLRNQVNHATTKHIISAATVEKYLEHFLKAEEALHRD